MVVGDFSREVDVLVVGGGPGGYAAAIRAAQLGKQVTLVEKEDLGGVCLNRGCIPSKALISVAELYERMQHAEEMGISVQGLELHMDKIQQWKNKVVQQLTSGVASLLKGHQVEVIKGEAYFTSPHEVRVVSGYENERLSFRHCIIATGSRPVELKAFPFDEQKILSSTGALNLQEIPQRFLVIGGGYIGVELGSALNKLGSEVIILEGMQTILPGFDKAMVQMAARLLKKQGITIHTSATATSADIESERVKVKAEIAGKEEVFDVDAVLVSVGRRPNSDELGLEAIGVERNERGFIKVNQQQQTSVPHIYAIGDVVGEPMLAHKAYYEAKVAAEAIAGMPSATDYQAMPFVIFSDPEMASVGLTKDAAKEQGIEVVTARFPFQANGRALSLNKPDGFVHIVADKSTQHVLGVQIVGPEASTMIAEAALAIEMGTTLEDLSLTVHPHPTLSEAIAEAAEVALGRGIHMISK